MVQTQDTQPNKPVAPKRHGGRAFLINALIVLAVIFVTVFAGYRSGIGVRKNYEASVITPQLAEQFQYAEQDLQAGRYENARQRLEFIIDKDPSFPGAQEKLTEVLVQINLLQGVKTPTPTPSLTPTPDFTGAEQAFARASQLIAAQDWPGALGALDEIRKLDPNYLQSQVDGMYYFALRNQGYDLILKQGNLEGGIYHLTLAERFGPLDRDTAGLREGARIYLIGASFWELNWEQAVLYFTQASAWGNLWDGTMTASERYWYASMRYGDDLFAREQYCDALQQYQNAQAVTALDGTAQSNYNEAFTACFPPTPTLDLSTPTVTPTLEGIPTTEVPPPTVDVPTETPTSPPP